MRNPFRSTLLGFSLFIMLGLGAPPGALGQQKLIDLLFARDVIDREPVGPFLPGPYCVPNGEPSSPIPVVDSGTVRKVFLWSHINSTQEGLIRHSWFKDDQFVGETDLKVGISHRWRSWSYKSINAEGHEGEWKVVISTVGNSDRILCVTHFTVR